ncbi:MAG: alpha/beta hydrolase [Flavobacteriales bacterium]|nr:alpha/beta hydrolase [Flavobacteriales bacterium]
MAREPNHFETANQISSHLCTVDVQQFSTGRLNHEYQTFGNLASAKRAIVAFHGFGRTAADFKVFQPLVKNDQVLFAFNLIHHGQSRILQNPDAPITPEEYAHFLQNFLKHHHLERCHLLGYSLGGKVCMMLVQQCPATIESWMLIAPDGVKRNRYYQFATDTAIGRKLFDSVVENPSVVIRFADWMLRLGIFNEKLHRFIHLNMENREVRALVRDVWQSYRAFVPTLKLLQHTVNSQHIPTVLIYGRHDSVIKLWQGEKLNAGLDRDSLHVLDTGHLLLEPRTISYLDEHDLWFD